MPKRKISWTKTAIEQFNAAIEHIRQDSDQNADKVKQKLLEKISQLADDKIVHRSDPFKINNDGSYLYFECLKYRVVYFVEGPKQVFIIRVRHTSREPQKY